MELSAQLIERNSSFWAFAGYSKSIDGLLDRECGIDGKFEPILDEDFYKHAHVIKHVATNGLHDI